VKKQRPAEHRHMEQRHRTCPSLGACEQAQPMGQSSDASRSAAVPARASPGAC
jgi:hypothetical protein